MLITAINNIENFCTAHRHIINHHDMVNILSVTARRMHINRAYHPPGPPEQLPYLPRTALAAQKQHARMACPKRSTCAWPPGHMSQPESQ